MTDNEAPTQDEITEAIELLKKPDWFIEFARSEIIAGKTTQTLIDIIERGPTIAIAANIAASFTAGFLTGYNRALKELQCPKTTN